jgi:valyl-tRNA synthetase
MESISGAYDPKNIEGVLYKKWEVSGYFNPDNLSENEGENYIAYMPLPNVTGTLHMGHALNNTLQDILIRFYRMRGKKTLWFPGTDHAGIATQFVVEKQLKKEGTSRFALGREKFIEKVWEWKNQYGNIIYDQLKKLGVSCDWSRVRFTMDDTYAKDVQNAFIHYHEKGFLYRGYRTVNWCPRCATSLSELELEYKEEESKLYFIKYGPFTLATTRPETKFGDTGLAVNPRDARYKEYVGKELEIESLSIEGSLDEPSKKKNIIIVVADDAVDVEFGTGIVKVTPAHDLVDFEIGSRHNLPLVEVINERGEMNSRAGKYAGMKTGDARRKIVEDLKTTGLLEKEEAYTHNVAVCYRCGHVIEPIPSRQWFLKMEALADTALDAVKNGKVKIHPENFEKPYTVWLEHIKDWTVSRQIWWGHQLPVYFCKNKQEASSNSQFPISNGEQEEKYVVSMKKPEKCPFCETCEMEQSPDVLDTWFSSALWPFAGLSESDRKKYYPGTTLITARDILNLWVARMIYSGIEFQNEIPFKDVLIHGTILTKDGKRMSKSLGTGIDPLKYIEAYGADATRFGIVWQANGQDIRWDETAITAGKKFLNKLWNASRFVQTQTEKDDSRSLKIPEAKTDADRNILAALAKITKDTETNLRMFEFSKSIRDLYEFFWHDFCDTYLEISKKQLSELSTKENTEHILLFTLRETLKLFHPFVPFITEEIYGRFSFDQKKEFLMVERA